MNSKNKELINWLVTVGVILVFLALSYFVVVSYLLTPPQKVEDCSHDLIYLSAIINAEADTTDTVDMFLVGSSVLNRKDSDDFPNHVDSVVISKYQYTGHKTDRFVRTATTDTVAAKLLRGVGRNNCVLYFVNPKTMLDKEFKNQLKQKQIVGMTVNHVFFGE